MHTYVRSKVLNRTSRDPCDHGYFVKARMWTNEHVTQLYKLFDASYVEDIVNEHGVSLLDMKKSRLKKKKQNKYFVLNGEFADNFTANHKIPLSMLININSMVERFLKECSSVVTESVCGYFVHMTTKNRKTLRSIILSHDKHNVDGLRRLILDVLQDVHLKWEKKGVSFRKDNLLQQKFLIFNSVNKIVDDLSKAIKKTVIQNRSNYEKIVNSEMNLLESVITKFYVSIIEPIVSMTFDYKNMSMKMYQPMEDGNSYIYTKNKYSLLTDKKKYKLKVLKKTYITDVTRILKRQKFYTDHILPAFLDGNLKAFSIFVFDEAKPSNEGKPFVDTLHSIKFDEQAKVMTVINATSSANHTYKYDMTTKKLFKNAKDIGRYKMVKRDTYTQPKVILLFKIKDIF